MSQEPKAPFRIIRKLLPYTTVATVLALLYVGWVFYARSNQNRELQREAVEKSTAQSRKTYELYGSGQLKLMLFYASPPMVAKGGATKLCYSVSNAATVKIEPGVEPVKPSLDRCVPVTPSRSTTYTLTAADEKGHEATQSVNVVVR